MKLISLLQVLLVWGTYVDASKVLMMLPLGSKSHKNIFTPLADNLALRGHEVTVMSLYGESNREDLLFHDVVAKEASDKIKRMTGEFNVFRMLEETGGKDINSEVMKKVVKYLPDYCESFLTDPSIEEVVLQLEKPDLVLLPAFMSECGLILVRRFEKGGAGGGGGGAGAVPFIYVTTSGLTPWTADLAGTPEHPAYVPNQYLPYDDQMTLLERTVNSVMRLLTPYLRKKFVLDRLDSVARKYLGDDHFPETMTLAEIERNVSLVFVNSHHSLGFPRPLTPNVVEIGGMHCRDPLPETFLLDRHSQLANFLNGSAPGSVLLFSLGSQIKSSQMPESFKGMFARAFGRLQPQYKVVWKFEGPADTVPNLPSNVLLTDWLPQQDLLGHKAVGAFLTHGGLLSTQEALYHGVPIIGLPIMSDQHLNVKRAQTLGVGEGLDLSSLTEDKIFNTISKVMSEGSYHSNTRRRSEVMRDQETKPLDRATFYAEYVIRHKGAMHLKSAATSLSTLSYYLVDVLALVGAVVGTTLILAYILLKFLVKKLLSLARKSLLKSETLFLSTLDHLKQQ